MWQRKAPHRYRGEWEREVESKERWEDGRERRREKVGVKEKIHTCVGLKQPINRRNDYKYDKNYKVFLISFNGSYEWKGNVDHCQYNICCKL